MILATGEAESKAMCKIPFLACLKLIAVLFAAGCWTETAPQQTGRASSPQNSVPGLKTSQNRQLERDFTVKSNIAKEEIEQAELSVLFIGNSHSWIIPKLLTEIYERQQPGKKVLVRRVRFTGFLVDHLKSGNTKKLIESGPWDYVVLQAQKYSTSGKYHYPYDAAIELSQAATDVGAKIIMYPEWPRRDVPDEYERIRALHETIAEQIGATVAVARIGEAWEAVRQENDRLELYAPDGNHASQLGSYLVACVFYSMIADASPYSSKLPEKPETEFNRRLIERVVWDAVQ